MSEREQTEARKRVSYTVDGEKMKVAFGGEVLDLDAAAEIFASHAAVRDHLVMVGLTAYLQRASARAKDEEKLDAVEAAYNQLASQGMAAFERKSVDRGPRKAEKIAALAAIKGATTDAVEKALANMDKEAADELLNHPKVLAKLEKMKRGASDVDLSL